MLDGVAMAHFGPLHAHFVGSVVDAFGRGGLVKDSGMRYYGSELLVGG